MGNSSVPQGTQNFVASVTDAIINPLLAVIFAAALVYFLWGLAMFIIHGENSSKRSEYQQHMLWGVVGMTVMVSVYAIIAVMLSTFGVGGSDLPDPLPFSHAPSAVLTT